MLGGPSSLAAQQQESATDPGFWVEQGDKVLVAVVTAVLVLLVQKPVKVLLDRVGRWLEDRLGGLGFRFRKRYLEALADRHRRLRLLKSVGRPSAAAPGGLYFLAARLRRGVGGIGSVGDI